VDVFKGMTKLHYTSYIYPIGVKFVNKFRQLHHPLVSWWGKCEGDEG